MRTLPRLMAIASLAGSVLLLAGPALADGDEAAFGQHVRMHAQGDMGLDGSHHPGMHQGASGWDPDHTHHMAP